MRIRLTTEADGRICVHSPFEFRDLIKELPGYARAWDPDRKRWFVYADYTDDLLELCTREQVEVRDDRQAATPATTLQLAPDNPYATMPADLREAFAALYLAPNAILLVAEASYKALSRYFHPDNQDTGDPEIMGRVNDAIHTIRHYF